MKIGIDASRAFSPQRTGIEEYSYQIIKHLMDKLDGHQVILYVRKNQKIEFDLPERWSTKVINFPRLWTQIGLSLEMLRHPIDVLFVSGHILPVIHPKRSIVTIHGLEYEMVPEAYSTLERLYMGFFIKKSCKWASRIIAVSKNTKNDLMNLYRIPEEKIFVVYEGVSNDQKIVIKEHYKKYRPYLSFIGRLEKRKNIEGIIEAFNILKKKYKVPHKLILAGQEGFGYSDITRKIGKSKFKSDIILPGYVSEEEKYAILVGADVFLFPSYYEGFGLPILEAQSVGTPVITSNLSSMPEVAEESALLVPPEETGMIAEKIHELIADNDFRNAIIEKGKNNVEKFSWARCASLTAQHITGISK